MGHVRQIPQVDQNGQKSGQVGLEITYGGKESPFGGIDTTAPPAYIAPNCFASADGFLVVDDQLCAASLQPVPLPQLYGGAIDIITLKLGTFYNSIYGYINYALGVFPTIVVTNPKQVQLQFYLTAWQYITGLPTPTISVIGNDIQSVKVYDAYIQPIAATLTLPVVRGQDTFTDSGSIGLNYGVSNVLTGTVSYSYTGGASISSVVAGIVAAINGVSGSTLFTAVASADGLSVVLTATTGGAASNNLQVSDASTDSTTPGSPPPYYFPIAPGTNWTNLFGGKDLDVRNTFNFEDITLVSTTDVGGTIYFANLGPFILKYAGPGTLAISTMYAGVRVISKFAGSLIGLGNLAQLLNTVQDSDMVFSWSASNNLDEWSPLLANGNVTGAGFTELDDIGDALRGLIVTNNTAFILREQGISYSTSLGSGEDPFSFQHVSLSDEGEGAQNSALICQYDQTGAFVGNTNVYQISGSITSIGEKIVSNLLTALQNSTGPLSATACAVLIGKRINTTIVFLIGSTLYTYLPDNQTWMQFTFTSPLGAGANLMLTSLSIFNSTQALQRQALCTLVAAPFNTPGTPTIYALEEGTGFTNGISGNSVVFFPQEELLFGRDVTIDSLYIAFNYRVTAQVTVAFFINGVQFSVITLTPGNNLTQNPIEMQVFPTAGVFTSHSPQLEIEIIPIGVTFVRFSKIQMYASFDPNQRPV